MNHYLKKEILLAKSSYFDKDYLLAFERLERIHIVGQKSVYWHTLSHYWMFKVALRSNDWPEMLGQLIRIPLGVFGSAVGVVPVGNSGCSTVGLFARNSIPDDLKPYIE